ncbi:MAG: hypothetical protein Q9202_004214 [Teloschistes flavicans]
MPSDERRRIIPGANDEKSEQSRNSPPQDPFAGFEETDSHSAHCRASPRSSTSQSQCLSSTNKFVLQNPFDRDGRSDTETECCARALPGKLLDTDNASSSSPPHECSLETPRNPYETNTTAPRISESSTDMIRGNFDVNQDGDEALVDVLFRKGADLHSYVEGTSTHQSYTALQSACIYGNEFLLQMLLHHGVSLEAADDWIAMPLCLAVRAGHVSIAHLLLESGVNVNCCCPDTQMTVVHLAAITLSPHSAEILTLLRMYGAVMDSHDAEGNTPLHRVVAGDRAAPISSSHPATMDSPFRYAIVKALIHNGARVDIPNHRGHYPLTLASRTRDLGVFRQVLAASVAKLSDRRLAHVDRYLRMRKARRVSDATVAKMSALMAATLVMRSCLN